MFTKKEREEMCLLTISWNAGGIKNNTMGGNYSASLIKRAAEIIQSSVAPSSLPRSARRSKTHKIFI